MFEGCSKLMVLDLSSLDTDNVTDMSWMFEGCSSLTNLDLSIFNTTNVTNMKAMFSRCYKLTSLNLGSNFSFVGSNYCLPSGTWYASDGTAYTSDGNSCTIPNNTADTYTRRQYFFSAEKHGFHHPLNTETFSNQCFWEQLFSYQFLQAFSISYNTTMNRKNCSYSFLFYPLRFKSSVAFGICRGWLFLLCMARNALLKDRKEQKCFSSY